MESNDCNDFHTLSNPQEVVVKHTDFELEVNFQTKTLSGKVIHHIENKNGSNHLILDTRGLNIEKVFLDEQIPASFSLGDEVPYLGRPLKIMIKEPTSKVTVFYSTLPECPALQWVSPQQTQGKKHPFVFTLSQSILARSWFPCQDTPGVRFTYTADIKVPNEMIALMSAENPKEKSSDGKYHFEMNQPIPSYLVALAAGNLSYEAVDEHSGIYAEPEIMGKASWEFAEMNKMMTVAEELCGKYRWDQFDVLILPKVFPFDGAGYPRLNFISSTVLSGDRSLVNILAHELAHSWSGNLVINATWNDIWLNEAFATYIERRLMEKLDGKSVADMLAVIGYQDLHQDFKICGYHSEHTKLKTEHPANLPDQYECLIAREKGYLFLLKIEKIIGRERWDAFLKNYFTELAFQAITTDKFIEYFERCIIAGDKKTEDQLGLFKWIFESGLPSNCPMPKSIRFFNVSQMVFKWKSSTPLSELYTKKWTTNEWLHFLRHLPANLTTEQMDELDYDYGFSLTQNKEILAAWLLVAVNNHYENCYAMLENFLTTEGRLKLLIPLYQAMITSEGTNKMAKSIFEKAKPNYHYICSLEIEKLMTK